MHEPPRSTPALIGALFGLIALGSISVAVVLPEVASGLGIPEADGAWLLSIYVLVFSVGTALYGRLGDVYGIRRPLAFGVGLMALGAVVCALSTSFPMIVAGRVLQACGAAAVPPLVMTMVDRLYSGSRRAAALGTVAGISSAVACMGPLVGGGVEALLDWRWTLALPATGVLALVPLWRVIPAGGSAARLDLFGAGLVMAVCAGIVLLIQSPSASWPAEDIGLPLVLAGVPMVAFHIRRRPDGFLPRRVLKHPVVVQTTLASTAITIVWFALLVAVPLLLVGRGWTSVEVGVAMVPSAVAGYLAARLTAGLLTRLGPALCLALADGGSVVAILLVAVGAATPDHPLSTAALVLGMMASMSVAGLGQSALVAAVASAVEPEVKGVAIGFAMQVFLVGGAIGSAAYAGFADVVGPALCLSLIAVVPAIGAAASLRLGAPPAPA